MGTLAEETAAGLALTVSCLTGSGVFSAFTGSCFTGSGFLVSGSFTGSFFLVSLGLATAPLTVDRLFAASVIDCTVDDEVTAL